MRVIHFNRSDRRGGAAIAARRLVVAQRAAGIDARLVVLEKLGQEEWVVPAARGALFKSRIARAAIRRLLSCDRSPDAKAMRSLGLLRTGVAEAVSSLSPDIVHWHWVGAESASLAELRETIVPAVWTCHDQWAFCGAEHYGTDDGYQLAYVKRSRLDGDALNFRRKHRAWSGWRPTLVCPSEWMARSAANSVLAREWPSRVIPNTLDTAVFSPVERGEARHVLDLPLERVLILFGADSGEGDPRKGFDLLVQAMAGISSELRRRTTLVTFGGRSGEGGEIAGMPVVGLGAISDPRHLAAVYNAADVFVAPSRQDNLPNTMVESQACGTPCAGFAIGGLPDIVTKPAHGVLAPAFETGALASAIERCCQLRDRAAIRDDAIARFGAERVVSAHAELYRSLLEKCR